MRKTFIRRFYISGLQAQVAGEAFAPSGRPRQRLTRRTNATPLTCMSEYCSGASGEPAGALCTAPLRVALARATAPFVVAVADDPRYCPSRVDAMSMPVGFQYPASAAPLAGQSSSLPVRSGDMFVRTATRRNKDGSTVRYLQLVHNEWDPSAKAAR